MKLPNLFKYHLSTYLDRVSLCRSDWPEIIINQAGLKLAIYRPD